MPRTIKISSMNPFSRKTSKKMSTASNRTAKTIKSRREMKSRNERADKELVNVTTSHGKSVRMTLGRAKELRNRRTLKNIDFMQKLEKKLGLAEGKRKTRRHNNILYPNNIPFKFYSVNQKKFVNVDKGPENVWKNRYKLDIWNNKISKKNIYKLGNLVKNNKKFILYIKVGNRYVKYISKLGKKISKEKKHPRKTLKSMKNLYLR
jgi:hypothetical protein